MNEQTHLTLHGLAVKKHASVTAVASLLGMADAEVETCLAGATACGRASVINGRYVLTPAGRMTVDANYSRYCAALRADANFAAAYLRFEGVNLELKQLITDWQTIHVGGRQLANDHSDAAHDEKILDRLGHLHDKATPVLQAMINALPRYAHYLAKLEHALMRVENGEHTWLSDATLESYHSVWFELHEDILRVLGRAREE